MFQLLTIKCNDYSVANIIWFIKIGIMIIRVAVPIILIVMATLQLIKMMSSPDDKNKSYMKEIIIKFSSAVIVFFMPWVVDLTLNLVTYSDNESFTLSDCWNEADEIHDILESTSYTDSDTDDDKKNSLGAQSEYEMNNNNIDYEHLNTYNQVGTYAQNSVCSSGGKTVQATACGLSTYMALRYVLTSEDTDFMSFCHEACNTGFFNGNGTSWHISESNSSYPSSYGIKSSTITNSVDSYIEELEAGNVVSMLVACGVRNVESGGYNASTGQHYIGLVGYDSSNSKIYVYNPVGYNTGWQTKETVQKYITGCGVEAKRVERN